jgi:hypothetical protein
VWRGSISIRLFNIPKCIILMYYYIPLHQPKTEPDVRLHRTLILFTFQLFPQSDGEGPRSPNISYVSFHVHVSWTLHSDGAGGVLDTIVWSFLHSRAHILYFLASHVAHDRTTEKRTNPIVLVSEITNSKSYKVDSKSNDRFITSSLCLGHRAN